MNIIYAILAIVGGVIAAEVVGWIIKGYARKVAPKTRTKIDDKLVPAVSTPIKYAILITGLLVGAYFLFPQYAEPIFLSLKVILILLLGKAVKDVLLVLFENYITLLPIEKEHITVLLGAKGFLNAILYLILILVMLSALGVDVWPLLTSLGVGGLAISLALKDVLSDYVAGAIMIISGDVKKGQRVTIKDKGVEGKIVEVGWRRTVLVTDDGDVVTLPNRVVAGAVIIRHKKA